MPTLPSRLYACILILAASFPAQSQDLHIKNSEANISSLTQFHQPVTSPNILLAQFQPNQVQLAQVQPTAMGMPGMTAFQQGAAPAAPQPLGPKAKGKIRVGIAPPDAQLGQGNNAGADYSTPIRNAEVTLMSGPAIEIIGLDSHIAMQLQAEAQQKECDFILYSAVTVKHAQSGGFGKFMKMWAAWQPA